jgi:hypothetical protein
MPRRSRAKFKIFPHNDLLREGKPNKLIARQAFPVW